MEGIINRTYIIVELSVSVSVLILICICVQTDGVASLVRWHSQLMSVSFLLFLPFATSVYKYYDDREKARQRHAVLAALGIGSAFAGILCIIIHASPKSSILYMHIYIAHVLGACLIALGLVIQASSGIAKFLYFGCKWHGFLGILLLAFGLVNLGTGLCLLRKKIDLILVACILIALLFLFIFKLGHLFFHTHYGQSRYYFTKPSSASLTASNTDDEEAHVSLLQPALVNSQQASRKGDSSFTYYSTFDAAAAAKIVPSS